MDTKSIDISLAGQFDRGNKKSQALGESRYLSYCLALNLKTGQPFREKHNGRLPLSETSMLIAVSESQTAPNTPDSLRRVPIEIMTKWLIKVSKRLPPHEQLIRGIEEANYGIWRAVNEDAQPKLISASMAVALVENNCAYVAQIGPAGAFILRNGRIRRLAAQQLTALKAYDVLPDSANDSEMSSVPLGTNKLIQPGITAIELQANDILLLSTSGVLDFLRLPSILQIASRNTSVFGTCEHLIHSARQFGCEKELALTICQFTGDGLAAQMKSVTNSLTFYGQNEQLPHLHTMDLSSVKQPQFLDENEVPQVVNSTRDKTLGLTPIDQLGEYERLEEIGDGFVNCSAQTVQTEALLQGQFRELKAMLDWAQSQSIVDPRLFSCYLKLDVALKKLAEVRELIEEAEGEFPVEM